MNPSRRKLFFSVDEAREAVLNSDSDNEFDDVHLSNSSDEDSDSNSDSEAGFDLDQSLRLRQGTLQHGPSCSIEPDVQQDHPKARPSPSTRAGFMGLRKDDDQTTRDSDTAEIGELI